MNNKEAIKYLIAPVATSTEPSAEYLKQKEAYELAIKALERPQGEWIHLQAIGDYKCSICGCENLYKYANEHERWVKTNSNFCPNCGAEMQKAVRNEKDTNTI